MQLEVSRTFDKLYKAYTSGLYRLIVGFGSSRSGKSYAIMQIFLLILMAKKNYKITVWRGTRVDAFATILEDFKAVLLDDLRFYNQFVFNKKDGTFTCKANGSVIHFMGTDVISKVLGMRQDISFFNEISHFSEKVYLQIAQRTTDVIFSDYNPSSDFFIEKYKDHVDSIFIRSTFLDNPFLSDGIINQLKSYNPYEDGSTEVIDGVLCYNGYPISGKNKPPPNILNLKNQTSNRYMYDVYTLGLRAEKPNRIFKDWKKCSLKYFNSLEFESYFGLDFGIQSPTAIIEAKFDGDNTFYLNQRLYLPSSKMGMSIADYLLLKMKIDTDEMIVCDSAKATMVQDLRDAGLYAIDALKGAGSIQRGITQMQGFNIVYTETSKDLEKEYVNYSYKIDRYGLITDDIDPKTEPHGIDGSRYIIGYLVKYLGIYSNRR